MLRFDMLTSFVLVVCAYVQLTLHHPFQTQGESSSRSRSWTPLRSQVRMDIERMATNGGDTADQTTSNAAVPDDVPLHSKPAVSSAVHAKHGATSGSRSYQFSFSSAQSYFPFSAVQKPSGDPRQSTGMGQTVQTVHQNGHHSDKGNQAALSPSNQDVFQDNVHGVRIQNQALTADTDAVDSNQRKENAVFKPDTMARLTDDAETATVSSILRDTFLGQSLPLSPSHFSLQGNMDLNSDLNPAWPARKSLTGDDVSLRKRNEASVLDSDAVDSDPPFLVQQRSQRCSIPDVLVGDEELPWTCRQSFRWRHLGEHVYPSRLYEAVCEGRTCWYGHFNCTAITYTLHVLQACLHGCQDLRVPSPLRSRWQWTDLNVTVGCQCVR